MPPNSADASPEQVLTFTPSRRRFPFFAQHRAVTVMKMDVFARSLQSSTYHLRMSYTAADDTVVSSAQINLPQVAAYGDLNQTSIEATDAGLTLDEIEDVMIVMHYRLA